MDDWISVKDKLPKEEHCLKDNEGGSYAFSKKVLVSIKTDDEQFVTTGLYSRNLLDNKHVWKATDYFVNMTDCVVAWMPLPEPYKAESEK